MPPLHLHKYIIKKTETPPTYHWSIDKFVCKPHLVFDSAYTHIRNYQLLLCNAPHSLRRDKIITRGTR